MSTFETTRLHHKVVSREEWLKQRKALLVKEKGLTHQLDQMSRLRRDLPWVRIGKNYVFEGANGTETLVDLFGKRSQLAVYHFMLGPGWAEGCPSCSMLGDHLDGANIHLSQRDVSLVVVSRAPYAEIAAFQQRMGWKFKWVSSYGSDFNFDFGVSFTPEQMDRNKVPYNYTEQPPFSEEAPGLSVFTKDEENTVYHTYSAYARGLEHLLGVYNFLDLMPKGRDEDGLTFSMSWVRHHDRYEDPAPVIPATTSAPREKAGRA